MKLRELIPILVIKEKKKFLDLNISGVTCDSRFVKKNFIFVAIRGTDANGEKFIDQAIKNGAKVIILRSKSNKIKAAVCFGVLFIEVKSPRKTLSELSAKICANPSSKIKVIGITGTNGKTTVSFLIESILKRAGFSTGLLGTIKYKSGKKVQKSSNTTPGPECVQSLLAKMVREKTDYCIMEVSSHALDQDRVADVDFRSAIFTNLTRDHLDYHKTFSKYLLAKSKLFKCLRKSSKAFINLDSPSAGKIVKGTPAKITTYGLTENCDIKAKDVELSFWGIICNISTHQGSFPIKTKLIGVHNLYNILAAVSFCLKEGIDSDIIKDTLVNFRGVPGRLEPVECGQPFKVFIDYAHTDDALKNVLESLAIIDKRKIIVVFGCGGDRDKTKRPKMGKVASELADEFILTNDNPRSEVPRKIVKDIEKGIPKKFKNYCVILDRAKAIKKAMLRAKKSDVVLIAGKGHENYQVMKDGKFLFSDKKETKRILKCLFLL